MDFAVLGLGEAGSEIAQDLAAAGADVRGFDPAVAQVPGVEGRADEADAVRDADVVLSVTPSHDADTALQRARPALRPGVLWAELSTTSAGHKRSMQEQLVGSGAVFVDVALMAPVPGRGLRTPMLAAGDGAAAYCAALVPLGAQVTELAGPAGAAAERKLLRSVFYKGVAAAVVESLAAACAAGCEDWLRDHLRAELARFDEQSVDRFVDGSTRHAVRRADEMAAAATQLEELGVQPRVASAARDMLLDLGRNR